MKNNGGERDITTAGKNEEKQDGDPFTDGVKILRDNVHEYINLTQLNVELIDTPYFQRLKDIRQLTCQHVSSGARHTRFDHSLGVMELTRQAIEYINKNGMLSGQGKSKEEIIDKNLRINTEIAALLHDVGHCPFSHLGETQFHKDDETEQQNRIVAFLKHLNVKDQDLFDQIKRHGVVHESLSCAIIGRAYFRYHKNKILPVFGSFDAIDFEFIIRCILGIKYNANGQDIQKKNLMIGLINSKTLDMDKLDYIMRDSFFTGVNAPRIDTKRLFKNMYISRDFLLVYTSKAVPVLQTIIETRDNLYLWVYNHHTTVYTDFLYSYILRRLAHNYTEDSKSGTPHHHQDNIQEIAIPDPGIMNPRWIFSRVAVMKDHVSDSTLRHYLSYSYHKLRIKYFHDGKFADEDEKDKKEKMLIRVLKLLDQLFRRRLLRSWWKTIPEYKNFMANNFHDVRIREKLESRICDGSKSQVFTADEFRSQIVKSVKELYDGYKTEIDKKYLEDTPDLQDGYFFVIDRSNKFYSLESLDQVWVYLKENEVIKLSPDMESQEGEYYAQHLTQVLPMKNYDSFYGKYSFYLYVIPYERYVENPSGVTPQKNEEKEEEKKKRAFYEAIKTCFVTAAVYFTEMTEEQFADYVRNREEKEKAGTWKHPTFDQCKKLEFESFIYKEATAR